MHVVPRKTTMKTMNMVIRLRAEGRWEREGEEGRGGNLRGSEEV